MNEIRIRRVTEPELLQATRIIRNSYNALLRKNGMPVVRVRVRQAPELLVHLRRTDPDGCLGAFDGNRMVGFASAIVRDYQWYLAFLFVAPSHWDKGIGRRLMTRALKIADPATVNLFSLCTFSYNPLAIALYSSFGMTPVEPILVMRWQEASGKKLRVPKPSRKLSIDVISNYEDLDFINKLDVKNRGLARPEEHKFAIDSKSIDLLLFRDGRKPVGYSMLNHESFFVAPISAISPEYLHDITSLSINRMLETEPKGIIIFCPGSNCIIVESLLKTGMKIREVNLLLSNRRFGDLDRYLPAHLAVF
jgi:GNAT superfamily N-acetyltransferase